MCCSGNKSPADVGVVLQIRRWGRRNISPMPDAPWIDAAEVEDLAARFPTIPRSRVELVLQAYWPVKTDVEAAMEALLARQQQQTAESLDFTARL